MAVKSLAVVVLSLGLLLGGCSDSDSSTSSGVGSSYAVQSVNDLSAQEVSDLVFMREEEKLARDVYSTLYAQWKLKIFSNISKSEQTHMDSIRSLLVKYGIDDPVTDTSVGRFTNTELAALYTSLVARGTQSEATAIQVGIDIEELDIRDLDRAIAVSTKADIDQVYQKLLSGSYNHLDAFSSYRD